MLAPGGRVKADSVTTILKVLTKPAKSGAYSQKHSQVINSLSLHVHSCTEPSSNRYLVLVLQLRARFLQYFYSAMVIAHLRNVSSNNQSH